MITEPTHSGFISIFPEFSSVPAERFSVWLPWAQLFLKRCRWRQAWELACYLYVAHFIVLEQRNAPSLAPGGDGGLAASSGVLTGESQTVDDVSYSYSYNAALTALDGQGQWGKTDYGQRLYQLIRMFGAPPLVT